MTKGIPSDIKEWGDGNFPMFLWAGQSNAVGVAPVYAQSIYEDIQVMGDDYRWHIAKEPCDNSSGNDFYIDDINHDSMAGYGAIKRFGIELRYLIPNIQVGIVPCARSGTSIRSWQRNLSDTSLYGAMLKRAKAATTRGKFKAFVFIQGEGDSLSFNYEYANNWNVLFRDMVLSLRYDLEIPNLPVIFAQLAKHTGDPEKYVYWELVKEKQALAETETSNSKMVVMDDVSLTINCVHYNVAGYNTLAKRLANAYYTLTNK